MPTHSPRPGDRMGRYRLVRPIGRGSTCVVWEATLDGPRGFTKPVALKLTNRVGDRELDDAIADEARFGALLHHPNVVGIHDLGQVDGRWFVAMDLVRGASLWELLKAAGPLAAADLAEVAVQVCAGLHHVHELRHGGERLGMLHRDIKPTNVLVDGSGVVKVADLGIARLQRGPTWAAGTPRYMAPEQGTTREDPRTDLYALGVTLYVLATGGLPFDTARGPRHPDLAALARPLAAAVPGLVEPVLRCLAGDPAERWPSARALADALAGARVGSDLGARVALASPDDRKATDREPAAVPDERPTMLRLNRRVAAPPEPWFGREAELDTLVTAIRADARLIGIVGPGGVGKTRLGVEAAAHVQGELRGGAVRVDLGDASSPGAVWSATARALDLGPTSTDPVRAVGQALAAHGRMVVLVDNADRVGDALTDTLRRWTEAAPDATFVLTSRRLPDLPGLRPIAVGPLARSAAVALFRDRCAAPPPDDQLPDVERLVDGLDGLPLAIELAAARTATVGVADQLARIDEPTGALRASLTLSLELLPPWALTALAQLSVFAHGFTLASAAAVLELPVDGGGWALDVLTELVNASLLRVDPDTGRFSMLAAIRGLAAEHLSGQARVEAEVRHGAAFARLGQTDVLAAFATNVQWCEIVLAELDELVAACGRAIRRGDGQVAVPTALAAACGFQRRGPLQHGAALLERVLTLDLDGMGLADEALEVEAQLAKLTDLMGRGEGVAAHRRVLMAARARGLRRLEARTLRNLAHALQGRDWPTLAEAMGEAALALATTLGDPVLVAEATYTRGTFCWRAGRWTEARTQLEAAHAAFVRAGHRLGEAQAAGALGALRFELGELAGARVAFEDAVRVHQALGSRRMEAIALGNLGVYEASAGDYARSVAHHEASIALHQDLGNQRLAARQAGNLGVSLFLAGDIDAAGRTLEGSVDACAGMDDPDGEGFALGHLAEVHLARGHVTGARAAYDRALALHRRVGNRRWEGSVAHGIAVVCRLTGDLDGAEAWIETAEPILREVGNRHDLGALLCDVSQLQVLRRQPELGQTAAEEALEVMLQFGEARSIGLATAVLASALRHRGEQGRARALLDEACADPQIAANRTAMAAVHAERGRVLLDADDPSEAHEACAAAVALAHGFDPFGEATANAELALALHRLGDPRATAHLASATHAAARLGVGAHSALSRAISRARQAFGPGAVHTAPVGRAADTP